MKRVAYFVLLGCVLLNVVAGASSNRVETSAAHQWLSRRMDAADRARKEGGDVEAAKREASGLPENEVDEGDEAHVEETVTASFSGAPGASFKVESIQHTRSAPKHKDPRKERLARIMDEEAMEALAAESETWDDSEDVEDEDDEPVGGFNSWNGEDDGEEEANRLEKAKDAFVRSLTRVPPNPTSVENAIAELRNVSAWNLTEIVNEVYSGGFHAAIGAVSSHLPGDRSTPETCSQDDMVQSNVEIVLRMLHDVGVDLEHLGEWPNAVGKRLRPLHVAVHQGNNRAVEKLLRYGVDPVPLVVTTKSSQSSPNGGMGGRISDHVDPVERAFPRDSTAWGLAIRGLRDSEPMDATLAAAGGGWMKEARRDGANIWAHAMDICIAITKSMAALASEAVKDPAKRPVVDEKLDRVLREGHAGSLAATALTMHADALALSIFHHPQFRRLYVDGPFDVNEPGARGHTILQAIIASQPIRGNPQQTPASNKPPGIVEESDEILSDSVLQELQRVEHFTNLTISLNADLSTPFRMGVMVTDPVLYSAIAGNANIVDILLSAGAKTSTLHVGPSPDIEQMEVGNQVTMNRLKQQLPQNIQQGQNASQAAQARHRHSVLEILQKHNL